MIHFNSLIPHLFTRKTQRTEHGQQQSSLKMTGPLERDKFELSNQATESAQKTNLNTKCLIENGNLLELLACNKLGINVEQFSSLEDLKQYFHEELEKIINEEGDYAPIFDDEHRLRNFKILDAKYALSNKIDQVENDPIKKFLFVNDFINNNSKETKIKDYNKEIADKVFSSIEGKLKHHPRKIYNVYNEYENKFSSTPITQLSINNDSGSIDITDQINRTIGHVNVYKNGYMRCLIVKAKYRHSETSKKVLNLMFKEAEKIAKENNLKSLTLDVDTYNTPAIKGYIKKQNFKAINFDVLRYNQPMEKILNNDAISNEELVEREKGTNLFLEYSSFDEKSKDAIRYALKTKDYSDLIDKEKEFMEKYIDYKENQVFHKETNSLF